VNTKAGEDRGDGGAAGAGARVSLRPVERTTVEQTPTLQPMEDLAAEQVGVFCRNLRPAETPRWSSASRTGGLPS